MASVNKYLKYSIMTHHSYHHPYKEERKNMVAARKKGVA